MVEKRKMRIDRKTYHRILVALAFFAAAALFILLRLAKYQIVDYEYYQSEVLNQITSETKVAPSRGKILCSDGVTVLADEKTVYKVIISPSDIDKLNQEIERNNSDSNPDNDVKYSWTSEDGTASYNGTRADELIACFLSHVLGVDYSKIMEKTAKVNRMYEEIQSDVEEETNEIIEKFVAEYDLSDQIYDRASSKRYYPNSDLAAQVIGFTNKDGDGVYGLEAQYNDLLKGTAGRYILAQDAKNNDMPFGYEAFIDAEDGMTIRTTIDITIQEALENQLKATYYDSAAGNRVTGVVMDVETGGILAMATYPSFDLNNPRVLDDESQTMLEKYKEKIASSYDMSNEEQENEYNKKINEKKGELLYALWKNKAITELYEPGSTFKIITTAMALEEKVITFDTPFYCGGSHKVEGYSSPIKCHNHNGHGLLPYRRGLQQSCNPALMQVAALVGQEKFYRYFEAFGYTSRTGIDLPAEAKGIYSSFDNFNNVSLAVYSFGQTFKTTPLQQITAVSTVANGGYAVTPHLLKDVVDSEGNVVQTYETDIKRQVVSTEVCESISEVLEEGVSGDGGAKNAYVKGYKVAAKTGTSEKRDKYDENGERPYRVGSTVAYAPADDPQVAAIIIVDEPMNGAVYGSVVAAPYISRLMGTILPYLGVEKKYTEDDLANSDVIVSEYVGMTQAEARDSIRQSGLTADVVGDGDTVTAQFPEAGSAVNAENGKVIVYCGDSGEHRMTTVPNLIGSSADVANSMIVNAGLNVHITGAANGTSATVITQNPQAGEAVEEGTVVEIELRHLDMTD